MSWSYSGNPKDSDLDRIRFMIGDVIEDEPYLQNEEIEFLLDLHDNQHTIVAVECTKSILARIAREVDYKIGAEQVSARQAYDNFSRLLKQLQDSGKKLSRPHLTGNLSDKKPYFDGTGRI